MGNRYIFSSESVGEGHPDKVSDAVSDAVLDAALAGDKMSRVACETLCKTGFVVLANTSSGSGGVDQLGFALGKLLMGAAASPPICKASGTTATARPGVPNTPSTSIPR